MTRFHEPLSRMILYDARASVKMPVLGLGEATLLHACTMGRKLGLLAINPAFIPTHTTRFIATGCNSGSLNPRDRSQHQRLHGSVRVALKKTELQAIFEREARRLIDDGADVIVPTGAFP